MCHSGNKGVKRTLNKSHHTKLTQEKKLLQPLLPGFKLATFWSQVQRSYQQAISASILLMEIYTITFARETMFGPLFQSCLTK